LPADVPDTLDGVELVHFTAITMALGAATHARPSVVSSHSSCSRRLLLFEGSARQSPRHPGGGASRLSGREFLVVWFIVGGRVVHAVTAA
jgi:hypothetical protein